MIDPAFGHWLAGFIDGEGCFSIFRVNNRVGFKPNYHLKFTLKLRDDDLAILEEIRARVGGIGVITRLKATNPGAGDQAVWQVQARADCRKLIDLLDTYPLRAKKARDYVLWRRAYFVWAGAKAGGAARGGANELVWARMLRLKEEMHEGRAYKREAAA